MMNISARSAGENNKEYAYRMIRGNIMALTLAPGQVISEIDLALALQLSRTPVREVLAKLKEEHLIDVTPQVGTYVSKITGRLIEEAAFMRVVLEKEVLMHACDFFPEKELTELKRNVELQERLIQQEGKELEFHTLDTDFHQLIFQGNRKAHVWSSITRLSTHYNRIRLLFEMEHSFEEVVSQHKKMIQIIEERQLDQVEAIVKQHIIEPMKLWNELYKPDSRYADYFANDLRTDFANKTFSIG